MHMETSSNDSMGETDAASHETFAATTATPEVFGAKQPPSLELQGDVAVIEVMAGMLRIAEKLALAYELPWVLHRTIEWWDNSMVS